MTTSDSTQRDRKVSIHSPHHSETSGRDVSARRKRHLESGARSNLKKVNPNEMTGIEIENDSPVRIWKGLFGWYQRFLICPTQNWHTTKRATLAT